MGAVKGSACTAVDMCETTCDFGCALDLLPEQSEQGETSRLVAASVLLGAYDIPDKTWFADGELPGDNGVRC
jgi:hypothetical protein